MAGYPPVTDGEKDAALRRIRVWHERREDPYWCHTEAEGTEPAYQVLPYLRRRHQPGHAPPPARLAAHDIWDEFVLAAWVYWDERRHGRERLHRARPHPLRPGTGQR